MLSWLNNLNNEDRYIKRNYLLNVFDGAFYTFAMSFVSIGTIIPVLVKKIGGSNLAVGLIPVFWTLTFNFPQIFIANYVRKNPYKKPLLLRTALGQRIPWLLMGLICVLFVDSIESNFALLLFFFCFILAGIAGSINLPGWFDLIAKLTPVRIRGRLFAARSIIGGILGSAAGVAVIFILDEVRYPLNFALLFFTAFSIMMISYILLLFLREEIPNHPDRVMNTRDFFRLLPSILKSKKNFRNFLIADSLLTFSLMSGAFFTIHALEKFSLADSFAGTFTIIMTVSTVGGNFLFGYLADRYGHSINLLLAAFSTLAACLLALFTDLYFIYLAVFVASSFTTTLIQLSRLPIVAEICSEEDRPTYVALTNVVTSPFSLSGIIGGWLAADYGYNPVFIISGFCALLSFLMYLFVVKEPRKLNPSLSK